MLKMSTDQAVTKVPVGDQENMSPVQEDALAVMNEISTPLNFSKLTPGQFGISVESFIPSSSNCKDKSRLAQIKSRRRSGIGARGSPETNSLIRFRAQQGMKTPPASRTPEAVKSSPVFPRVPSTLRQKMASFQSLMDVVESDGCDPTPAPDGDAAGRISDRDYPSDGLSCSEEKENNPPATGSKPRRPAPLDGCSVEIREENISGHHSSLKEQEDASCKHQSPGRPPSDDPSAVSDSHPSHIPSLPTLLEMKPPANADETPAVKKKKQVRFGGPLSPEFFDKNLPPSTPLKKGGTPARAATPGGGLQPRSVLKTPQRSDSEDQLDLLSLAGFGASPTFSMSHKNRVAQEREDDEDGKIVFPSMEETDSAVSSEADCPFNAQPLNLNMAFHEESLSQHLRETEPEPNQTSQTDQSTAEEKQLDRGAESPTPIQSTNRRRAKNKESSEGQPGAQPSKRKRKQPEVGEPLKRSTRSAAKLACRKMKVASSAAHRWNKDVDYSLYGSREYASKNPTLSPITERLSFIQRTSARQQTLESPTATHQGYVISLQMPNVILHREDCSEGNFSIKSVSLPSCSPERNNRQPRITAKRVRKKRKVSVADCEVLREEITEQQLEVDVSQGTLSTFTKSEQREADPEEPSADILCTDSSKSKYDASTLTPTSSYAPLGEDSSKAKPAKKQAKQGRRSSALLEPHQAGEHQPDCEGNGNQEEERGPIVDLAPWQAHFNFEDVFKPVATRRQRSVRRSLRSQVNSEHVTTGLAWVPHTSPESIKETRRRTRHRRLSATLPVQPALPEEAQDSSSSQWTPGKL
ncbi:cell division cycle-associated protein 2 isoform X2 [Poecilia reticulata]|uniref:cell division cycle-associated protein 2 isoform X2 n=1 Tax=Poecilia reticulata TaxID=8081 RepID=UPI0004A47911|nr:PREDICTED: cell division cycle-associated protein 2 isoform X2 [Poecilia reticulata]